MTKKKTLFDKMFIDRMQNIFDPITVSMILVNQSSEIVMINDVFANYLGYTKKEIIGKHVLDVDKNSRFPYVIKNKKVEIAWKHRFANGHTAIVHRIPVMNEDNEVEYGFGMVLFEDIGELKDLVKKNKLLEDKLYHYKSKLKRIQGAKYSFDSIIGDSQIMQITKNIAKKAAQGNSNVLIVGESGTGKELFAHAIHIESIRAIYPFVKVNCAAIPKDLLESELFGYEGGAFTGAKKSGKIGKFELANGGTIFLDEIGDMPLNMQAKLLRVLQEKEIERVGGNKVIPIDSRVIAATNKNLWQMVKENKFREDLFYRLNVMSIELPPLRNHKEDIKQLSYNFVKKLSQNMGKNVDEITEEAMLYLENYNWPGNARQLENVIERATNLTDNSVINQTHLPSYIREANSIKDEVEGENTDIVKLKEIIEKAEKKAINECLRKTKGNKLKTSRLLGISRSSLYEKIVKYELFKNTY